MAFDGWSFACPDWFERLQDGRSPIPDLPIDRREADHAVRIFNELRLPDVPGQPKMRDAAGEWIRDVVRAIFGSMQTSASAAAAAARRVGEVFLLVPKKNAKTTSAAAIALTFMLLNHRPKADMLIIGPTQKISDTAFQQAKGMIEADAFLRDRFHVRDHRNEIFDRLNGARLMIRTFGMDVLTGCKPVFCLIDEVHILGGVSYAADVMRQIRGGMLPFPEACLVMITTQSDHPPEGVFKLELDYARAVRDGRITEGVRMLPVLYELPVEIQADGERWRDTSLWPLVTPNMGRSITLPRLIEGMQRAEHDGVHEVIAWATQHLNVEVGIALHADRWSGAEFWADAGMPGLTLEALIDCCDVAVVGIDGGGLDDLASMAVIGRHRETRVWLHWARAWCHPVVLERRKEIAAALRGFADDGDLVITEAQDQDAAEMAEICVRLRDAGLLPETKAIGVDVWGITAVIDALDAVGIGDEQVVGVAQGYKLNGAIVTAARRLKDKALRHGRQPICAWSVGNAKQEVRGSNLYITKEKAGVGKIDVLMATFNAVQLMMANPVSAGTASYLDDAELMVV